MHRPTSLRRLASFTIGASTILGLGVAGTVSAETSPTDDGGIGVAAIGATHDLAGNLLEFCPVGGPSTFDDSWGWARSGGRSHEGVDMTAERGTPVMAVRDGAAQFKSNRLGGKAVWLTAPDGDRFYYAHLDGWNGESRDVEAGELIGWVGSTGNAGGPHLHFETLPGGQVENPFPPTLRVCLATPAELTAGTQATDAIRAGALAALDVWKHTAAQD